MTEPAAGRLQFAGREGLQRATSCPTLVQIFDDSGGIVATAYLWPADAMPEYEPKQDEPADPPPDDTVVAAPNPTDSAGPTDSTTESRVTFETPPKKPVIKPILLGTAGAAIVTSGVLNGLAYQSRRSYDGVLEGTEEQTSTPEEKQDALDFDRQQTHGKVISSAVLGIAGIGLGTTALVVRF